MRPSSPLLEARSLAARRGYATLFQGVSFALVAGGALAVSGPNGCGKTTLLRMLAGLAAPAEGEILLGGTRVHPFDPRLRDAVAFNGHLPALKDELTAIENLAAWTTLENERADLQGIDRALDRVALGKRSRIPARALSQGQRRRIGLARLALSPRRLWILDEPLTALDGDGVDVLEALLAAQLDGGGIVVAASHQALPVAAERLHRLDLALAHHR
ncbi:MAG: cytochrome c biogenesis heme-transporting ATPase CcmA [Betaproteobacteria bacterium]|nr:cytochrome c biogenesis heme-transporting ATPase CcmA [Betaproteobacteria bacterium]